MDFFLACSLLRLNSLPSVRYRMSKPGLASRKASVSIAENIMLNSVGARTQPCFTPFVTGSEWKILRRQELVLAFHREAVGPLG